MTSFKGLAAFDVLSAEGLYDAIFFSIEQNFGEELGVLPGMDPIFSALALERLVGFFGNVSQRNHNKDKFDIIVYDGMSSEEILRMISAAGKARSRKFSLYHTHMHSNTPRSHMLLYKN